jgi:hypothetical protein
LNNVKIVHLRKMRMATAICPDHKVDHRALEEKAVMMTAMA